MKNNKTIKILATLFVAFSLTGCTKILKEILDKHFNIL